MLLMPRRFALLLLLAAGSGTAVADADSDPVALAAAQAIAGRPANEGRVGVMHFSLSNASGATRQREALMFHSDTQETIRIAIFFTQPAMISDTAFLSFDHRVGDDENWLYLPATERVRRLPVSDRGDYFMGTDLSYGDIKDDFKFGLEDWMFSSAREQTLNDVPYLQLEGKAQSAEIIAETGYSRFTALIDTERSFPVDITYMDADGDPLKHIVVEELDIVGGAWTAMRFKVEQLQSGHTTLVYFTNMQHRPDLDDSVFDADSLAYGAPFLD